MGAALAGIAVYNASDLVYRGIAELPPPRLGWAAINPHDGMLYTSGWQISPCGQDLRPRAGAMIKRRGLLFMFCSVDSKARALDLGACFVTGVTARSPLPKPSLRELHLPSLSIAIARGSHVRLAMAYSLVGRENDCRPRSAMCTQPHSR